MRFARADELDAALVDIEAWDYRALVPGEADGSNWIAVERGTVRIGWWWLQWFAPGQAELHGCVRPGERMVTRHTIRAFPWIAELFGARGLWAVPGDSKVTEYMRRAPWSGWREVRPGVFRLEG